ncbi:MAG: hypothetical protein A3E38_00940 [Candidatus Moranbacteria bacterium RIFCSPHIGHO2_12_FULL_54_9]|nr:MAG: hypothetical protein A2878_02090 [Candidatus Moranbacteria bacterium RIFCSPHIGHO2_01_FULL_54_31]OGI24682.1 MAG: hypothetical protein A3E38_00940 [Candidatus Moranbacteria bacterium RIFCSPHIGHO2_12_FULL_54_9]
MHAFADIFFFIAATGTLFFLPGWILVRLFFGRSNLFLSFETLLFSFGLSVGLIDFLMILLGTSGFLLSAVSLSVGIITSVGVLGAITLIIKRRRMETPKRASEPGGHSLSFNKRQGILFITLITLTLLIKVIYLSHAVLPTATDLGHHMYWSKLIAVTGELPVYAKQEIIADASDTYRLTDPEPIPDFIIGEHLPFAALQMFTGLDFLSAFPVIFLLLINLLSVIALFTLTLRLASDIRIRALAGPVFTPQNIALAALFLFGPLYTLASPQAKFVSGGVVGNTFGNLFIPLIILAYYRAFKEKHSGFLALGFFLTFVLAYIHHLSTLILLFILILSALAYLILASETLGDTLRSWWKLFYSPLPLLIALGACLFFFTVAMPTYIETNAVGTALGTPTKTTRTGLSFFQIVSSIGDARVALGLAGLLVLIAFRGYARYGGALLIGWCVILLMMTHQPGWLFIDIPSNRIVTYLSFPIGILAALAAVAWFGSLKTASAKFSVPGLWILLASLALFAFATGSGSSDNNQTLLSGSKALGALQTFAASEYLARHNTDSTVILKDHNYIVADSWMKLFFLRDYAYPLSRGFFKRYEDNPHREQCTLLMIAVPNTARGEKCYDELGVGLVVVNPHFDTAQFEKSQTFSRIYASEDIHIYARKK